MNINELRLKKEALQSNIFNSVHKLVEEFKLETGISPNSVYIEMINVYNYTLLNDSSEFVVGKVKVDVSL